MRLVGYFWHLQKSHFRWVGVSEWLARARPQELGGTCGWERESGEPASKWEESAGSGWEWTDAIPTLPLSSGRHLV